LRWVDPTGLYGYIYDVHGSLLGVVKNSADFQDFLTNNVGDSQIGQIAIYGHGSISDISFDAQDRSGSGGTLSVFGSQILLSNKFGEQGKDITALLKKRLAPKARILLGGCDTAGRPDRSPAISLAQLLSSAIGNGTSVIGAYQEVFPQYSQTGRGVFGNLINFVDGNMDMSFGNQGVHKGLINKVIILPPSPSPSP
jgi:hypothetical protein